MKNIWKNITYGGLGLIFGGLIWEHTKPIYEKFNSSENKKYKALDEIIMMEIPDSVFLPDADYYNLRISNSIGINFTEEDKIKISSGKYKALSNLVNILSKNINFQENENTSTETMLDRIKQNYEVEGVKITEGEDVYVNYFYWDKFKSRKVFNLVLVNHKLIQIDDLIKEIEEIRKEN